MSLKLLSETEKEILRECLVTSVKGPFFDDNEFHTLFGLTKDEVKNVLSAWPNVDDTDQKINT